jgi:hypothetical protein
MKRIATIIVAMLAFGMMPSQALADEDRPAPDLNPCKAQEQTIADLQYTIPRKNDRIDYLEAKVARLKARLEN